MVIYSTIIVRSGDIMNEVLKLIRNKDYIEAEKEIEEIIKTGNLDEKNKIKYYYLISLINNDYDNKNKNIHKAKRYIKMCINSKFVEEPYYILYSKLEDDKIILESTIQSALKKFPRSQYLNQFAFKLKSDEQKKEFYIQIKDTPIFKEEFILLYSQFFFSQQMWNKLVELDNYSKKVKNKINYIFFSFAIGVAKLMSSSNKSELIQAKEKLENLMNLNNDNILENNLHIFLAYCYMRLNENRKFQETVYKLPIAIKYMDLDDYPYSFEMNFSKLYKFMFTEMINYCSKNKQLKQRLSVIYSLYLFYPSQFFSIVRFSKKNINDIISGKNLFDNYIDYYKSVCYMYDALKEKLNAFKIYLESPIHSYDKLEITLGTILEDVADDEILLFQKDFMEFLKTTYLTNEIYQCIVTPFIDKCYDLKKYELIYKISSQIGIKKITLQKDKLPLFEMAYSARNFDILFSKSLYELNLKIEKSHATFNNLGTIYEELGFLSKASDLFNKALKLDEFEDIYKNNCERISKRILKQSEARSDLIINNFDFLEILLILSMQRDKYNIINIDKIDITKFENLSKENIKKYCNMFISKGFYIKQKDNIVVDMDLFELLNNLSRTINKNKEYKKISDNINYEKLNLMGYNEELIKNLNKISDKDLVKILKRDLKECAIAYVAQQYKSTIILGGSIIETILTYILKNSGIKKYEFDINSKKTIINLDRMGIEQMLYVAKEEKLINNTIYHLDHYVREYRNAIHPAVEIRKKYSINDRNATMIWQILKETILTIF